MHSLRHLHLPHHRLLKKDFLYIAIFLRTLYFVPLFTFLPSLIYRDFLYLGKREALAVVSLFFFIYVLVDSFFIFFLPRLYSWFGLRFGLVLSIVLTFFMAILLNLKLYFLASYIYGILNASWWVSYNTLFLIFEREGKLGEKIGKNELIIALSTSVSPFLTGYILYNFGEFWFYAFLSFTILIALFFVLKISNYKLKAKINFELIMKEILKYKNDFLGFMGAGAETMVFSIYWPLFLYFFFKNFLSLGIFSSVVAFLSAIFSYFLGIWLDKKSKDKRVEEQTEKIGVYSFSSSWLGKAILQSSLAFAFFDVIHRIFNPFFVLPFTKKAFEHAKGEGILRYVIFRELGYRFGRLLVLYFVFVLAYFDLPYILIFVLAGLVSLLPLKLVNG